MLSERGLSKMYIEGKKKKVKIHVSVNWGLAEGVEANNRLK